MPRIFITAGPNEGHETIIGAQGTVIVGRDKQADLKISDPMSSRKHFKVEARGNGFHITDMDSRNGTFVNGTRILDRPIQPGDEIRVGETFFALEDDRIPSGSPITINTPEAQPAPIMINPTAAAEAPSRAPAPRRKVVYDTSDAHAGQSIFGRLFNGVFTLALLCGLVYGSWWAYTEFQKRQSDRELANDDSVLPNISVPDVITSNSAALGGGSDGVSKPFQLPGLVRVGDDHRIRVDG